MRAELEFTLVILYQLRRLDPLYSLFVVQLALGEPSLTDEENEKLLDLKFSISIALKQGTRFMYEAIQGSRDPKQRRKFLGEFFTQLYRLQKPRKTKREYRFSHADIDSAIKYLQERVEPCLESVREEDAGKLRESLAIIISLQEDYLRQVETSRYLWRIYSKLEAQINRAHEHQSELVKSLLGIQVLILETLFVNMSNYGEGEHILIAEPAQSQVPSSKDLEPSNFNPLVPNFPSIIGKSKRFDASLAEFDTEELLRKGRSYLIDHVKPEGLKLKSGVLKPITLEDVKKRLIFAHARL